MNVYTGKTKNNEFSVFKNDTVFDHKQSLTVVNHSPCGFAWGYYGSGPSQLALALLLDNTDTETAKDLYQKFKNEVIAKFEMEHGWTLTSNEIEAWLIHNKQNG